ncbi:HD domain-containing protein [Patescibacteria group bacterium]|nr:HD domain-containing protein [Patescibacteria group bacterium]
MKYTFPTQVESVLQEVILPDLEKGRKRFDLLHTQAVVYWMENLLEHIDSPDLDPLVLITAAYAHDWGYKGLFDHLSETERRSIDVVHKMKPLHMERGAQMIAKLLKERLNDQFTPAQQERVAHLVRVHDLVEDLKAEDEILLMEADTLGMLDADRMKPAFSKEDNDIFMEQQVRNRRFLYFTHPYAKEVGEQVFQKRVAFYEQPEQQAD